MYSVDLHYQPFLFRPLVHESLEIPQEFLDLLEISKKVRRYDFSDPEINIIFNDHTECHTRRIALHAKNIPPTDFLDHDKIVRMAWIHDLPEGVAQADDGKDVLAHLSNPLQDAKELATAIEILNTHDLDLYNTITYNKHKLNEDSDEDWDIDYEAVTFKVLDWVIEGIVSHEWFLTQYMRSIDFSPNHRISPQSSLDYTENRPSQIYTRISRLSNKHRHFREYILQMIREDYYRPAIELWSQVPTDRIPFSIQEKIQSRQKFYDNALLNI